MNGDGFFGGMSSGKYGWKMDWSMVLMFGGNDESVGVFGCSNFRVGLMDIMLDFYSELVYRYMYEIVERLVSVISDF